MITDPKFSNPFRVKNEVPIDPGPYTLSGLFMFITAPYGFDVQDGTRRQTNRRTQN